MSLAFLTRVAISLGRDVTVQCRDHVADTDPLASSNQRRIVVVIWPWSVSSSFVHAAQVHDLAANALRDIRQLDDLHRPPAEIVLFSSCPVHGRGYVRGICYAAFMVAQRFENARYRAVDYFRSHTDTKFQLGDFAPACVAQWIEA